MDNLKETHFKCLSEHFTNLRDSQKMVDVYIVCHDTKFPAHKIILSATSLFFQSAIENNEDELTEIEINNMDVESIEDVLDFIYTGKFISNPESDWARFCQLLCASNALGINHLFKYCCQVAKEKMDSSNFFQFWDLSEKLGELNMLDVVFDFASRNLNNIKSMKQFCDLDTSRVHTLMKQTDQEILSEDQLLDALLIWTKHDLEHRQDSFDDLFASMKSRKFSLNIPSSADDLCSKSKDPSFSKLHLSLQDSVVATEEEDEGKIYSLPEMTPDMESFLNSVFFHHYYVIDNVAFWRACSVRDGWADPVELPFLLAPHAAIVPLGGQVYFIGGLDAGMKPTSRVLRYDPLRKIADFVSPLLKGVWDAAAGTSWGRIYIVGGKFLQNGLVMITDVVQSFDPATCTWTEVNTWHVYRSLASAITINGNFYIAGGFEYVDCKPCQRIIQFVSTSSQAMTIMLPEPVADISDVTAVCLDKIYVLRNTVQKAFLVYDPTTKVWCARHLPGGPKEITRTWSLCNKTRQLPYILTMGSEGELWLLHPLSGQWARLRKDCRFGYSDIATIVFTTD